MSRVPTAPRLITFGVALLLSTGVIECSKARASLCSGLFDFNSKASDHFTETTRKFEAIIEKASRSRLLSIEEKVDLDFFVTRVQNLSPQELSHFSRYIHANDGRFREIEKAFKDRAHSLGLTPRRMLEVIANQIVPVSRYFESISSDSKPEEVMSAYDAYFEAYSSFWAPLGMGNYDFEEVIRTAKLLRQMINEPMVRDHYLALKNTPEVRNTDLGSLELSLFGSFVTGKGRRDGDGRSDLDIAVNHGYFDNDRRAFFERLVPEYLERHSGPGLQEGFEFPTGIGVTQETDGTPEMVSNVQLRIRSNQVFLLLFRGRFVPAGAYRSLGVTHVQPNDRQYVGPEVFLLIDKGNLPDLVPQ